MNSIIKKVLLIICSIFLVICILEFILNVLPYNNRYLYDKIVWNHWKNPYWSKVYNELYRYDEFIGYEKISIYKRIKEIIERKEDNYKILILGDSVSEGGKYINYFRDMIKKRYDATTIEIVNAGVMGYDTELEYRYLKHRGMDLKPNLVIIQVNMNDFWGTPIIVKQKNGNWFAYNSKIKIRWINPLLFSKFKLYQFIAIRLMASTATNKNFVVHVKEPLQKIKHLLEVNNIQFYLLVFPYFCNTERAEETYTAITQIVKDLDIESNTIDLKPYYAGRSFDEISRNPSHPNEEGDRIAAQALFERLTPLFDTELLNK